MGENRQGSAASKRSKSVEVVSRERMDIVSIIVLIVCALIFAGTNIFMYVQKTTEITSKVQILIKEKTNNYDPEVLNNADIQDYLNIKGIGLKTANSIILYRELLGGFTDTEQLLEIKGIGEKTYAQILVYFYGDQIAEELGTKTEETTGNTEE